MGTSGTFDITVADRYEFRMLHPVIEGRAPPSDARPGMVDSCGSAGRFADCFAVDADVRLVPWLFADVAHKRGASVQEDASDFGSWAGHAWLTIDGMIFDPTAGQFGSLRRIDCDHYEETGEETELSGDPIGEPTPDRSGVGGKV